jgi:hypothetical protein
VLRTRNSDPCGTRPSESHVDRGIGDRLSACTDRSRLGLRATEADGRAVGSGISSCDFAAAMGESDRGMGRDMRGHSRRVARCRSECTVDSGRNGTYVAMHHRSIGTECLLASVDLLPRLCLCLSTSGGSSVALCHIPRALCGDTSVVSHSPACIAVDRFGFQVHMAQ